MNYVNSTTISLRVKIMSWTFIVIIGLVSFSSLQLILPLASASGSVPFFQLGPDPNDAFSQGNISNSLPSNIGNVTLKTYENPGFGLSIQYPSSWAGMQLRADPFAQTNTSIVSIFEAPRENQSDPYRENLIINVQGPLADTISLEEYTQNSLNAFSTMSDTIMVLESSPSTLSGLPAHEIIYSSSLENLNLKKMQIFTIVNDNTAYVVTFGAEESQFNKYIPVIMKMVNSIRINQQAMR
jgi:eukaryotic-like serine/threonine-protein kinase